MNKLSISAFVCLILSLSIAPATYADDDDSVIDVITEGAGNVGSSVADFIEARSPLNGVAEGVNDFARTVSDVTTVGGEFDTTVTITGDVLQTIEGGTGNRNVLDVGAVSGGAYVDGKFTSIVELSGVSQTITGSSSTNRASIGSVSR